MGKSLISKIIIIIVLILIIIITSVIMYGNSKKDKPDEVSPFIEEYINATKGKLVKVDNLTDLYMIKNCIQKFYENLCAINYVELYTSDNIGVTSNTAIQLVEEENRNKSYFSNVAYQCLAKEYIDKNKITLENINTLNTKNFENINIEIYSLYYVSQFENVYSYFVNGIVRDSVNNEGIEFNYIVNIDINTSSFEIYLDNYMENSDFSKLEEGNEISFNIPEKVEDREYNTFNKTSVKYSQAVQDTFYSIRRIMLYDTQKAYNILTDNMKNKYPTYDGFKAFVDSNNSDIFKLIYGSYQLKSSENGAIFVMYNSDNTIRITAYYDGFSNYKFDIEKLK